MAVIESFLAKYPATISTIATGATIAAVIAALYLARRQSRARLEIFADVNRYISSEAQIRSPTIELNDAPRMVSVTIRNIGPVPVSIPYWSSFVWRVPGGKKAAMQNPSEPDFLSQPIELLPGKSISVVLSHDLDSHVEMMKDLAATSRLGAWSIRFPRLSVTTEIGDRFSARLGKSLRELSYGQERRRR